MASLVRAFATLDIDISTGLLSPGEVLARIEQLAQEAHADWDDTAANYFGKWAAAFPGTRLCAALEQMALESHVALAVRRRDVAQLQLLSGRLAEGYPDSWVTRWAKAELENAVRPQARSGLPAAAAAR